MRTYRRRTQERNEIANVRKLCRLCLVKTDEGIAIFRHDEDVCAAIAMRIMICVGLEMTQDDCLPNMICTNCYNELERYYKFRRKCEITYHKLKSHLLAVKYKDIQETQTERSEIQIVHKDIEIEPKDVQIEHVPKVLNDVQLEMQINDKYLQIENNMEVDQKPIVNKEQNENQIDLKNIPVDHNSVQNDNGKTQSEHKNDQFEIVDKDIHIEQPVSVSESELYEKTQNLSKDLALPELQQPSKQLHDQSDIGDEKVVEAEEVQIPLQTETNPNIGTFLTAVLTELGILGSQEDGLLLQEQPIGTFELETGDDEQVLLELIEEDDDVENQLEIDLKRLLPVSLNEDYNEELNKNKSNEKQSNKGVKKVGGGGGGGGWCARCGRTFSSSSAATRHARAHRGARQHACQHCQRTFAQKAVRDRHQLVHLAVRPHQCSQCSKSFTQRGALTSHARSHAPPHARPLTLHRCSYCDKVFLYASGLSRHMTSHAGRVYECSACDKRFNDRSSLLRHLRNVYHHNKHDNT